MLILSAVLCVTFHGFVLFLLYILCLPNVYFLQYILFKVIRAPSKIYKIVKRLQFNANLVKRKL